jgi:hypothetical protein
MSDTEDRQDEEGSDDERVAGDPDKPINDPLTRTESPAPQAEWGEKGS